MMTSLPSHATEMNNLDQHAIYVSACSDFNRLGIPNNRVRIHNSCLTSCACIRIYMYCVPFCH